MVNLMELDTVHSILNIYILKNHQLKYLFIIYMGYLYNNSNSIETSQKGERGERGVGFALTADEHYHLKGKRLMSQLLSITTTQPQKNSSLIY